jgi:hypothetical protein
MYCSSDAKSTAGDAFPPGAPVGVRIRRHARIQKYCWQRASLKAFIISLSFGLKDAVRQKQAGKRFSPDKSGSLNLCGCPSGHRKRLYKPLTIQKK